MSSKITELTADDKQNLIDWLRSGSGAHHLSSHVWFESVEGGGLLLRVAPSTPPLPPLPALTDGSALRIRRSYRSLDESAVEVTGAAPITSTGAEPITVVPTRFFTVERETTVQPAMYVEGHIVAGGDVQRSTARFRIDYTEVPEPVWKRLQAITIGLPVEQSPDRRLVRS